MSLNLNYTAGVLVDTEGMDEETWKKWRKKGIGGSDVAAIFNISPFRTKRDLYYDKAGIENAISDEEDNWVAKAVGHRLEDLVAEIFAKKTGYKVWAERKMYYHPLYPYMLADIDYMYETPDGEIGTLECKTSHYSAREKWKDDAVPIYYEYQVRHYLAVRNVNSAYIACLFGNNENDFVFNKIERDLDIEEVIITELGDFWNNNVLAKNPPPYLESGDLVLKSIRKHYGDADATLPLIEISGLKKDILKEYLELKDKKKELESQANKIKEKMQSLYAPLVDEMGQACRARCRYGDSEFVISYNPRYDTRIRKEELKLLKDEHPEIYDKYVSTSESRIFDIRYSRKAS